MKVHLDALGCRLNEAELQHWAQGFRAAGLEIANDAEAADILVLNTCAVTGEAGKKSRQRLRKLHRGNPSAHLVVSGCYASLEPEQIANELGVDLVVPNTEKDQLVEQTLASLGNDPLPANRSAFDAEAVFDRGRARAFVKVQDGCRYRCTYCIVTIARGEERSRPVQAVVKEINELVASGTQEVIISGVHLGGYGDDIDSNLSELIQAILDQTELPRLRLGSLEPWDLPTDFFALFDNPRLMPHLHLPLQSGSDAILRKMSRRCRTQDFQALIQAARQRVPGINITTDIIVGFPGESEERWQETMQFVAKIGFGHIHIFPYSNRPDTKAASLPGQLDNATKKQRVAELRKLAQKQQNAFAKRFIGSTHKVLWEQKSEPLADGKIAYSGYTPNNLRVRLEADTELTNRVTSSVLSTYNENLFTAIPN